MSAVYESRPGEVRQVNLGGNYAQPSASRFATWDGESSRHLGWAGDRNAGQPMYLAGNYELSQSNVRDRLEQLWTEYLGSSTRASKDLLPEIYQSFLQMLNGSFAE